MEIQRLVEALSWCAAAAHQLSTVNFWTCINNLPVKSQNNDWGYHKAGLHLPTGRNPILRLLSAIYPVERINADNDAYENSPLFSSDHRHAENITKLSCDDAARSWIRSFSTCIACACHLQRHCHIMRDAPWKCFFRYDRTAPHFGRWKKLDV